jgi:hypothetical protein
MAFFFFSFLGGNLVGFSMGFIWYNNRGNDLGFFYVEKLVNASKMSKIS